MTDVTDAFLKRFWDKVEKTESCWVWFGAKTGGYGQIKFGDRIHYAHRISYMLATGAFPKYMIDHLCRNPACVNPKHMEDVTNMTNSLRGISPAAQNARKVVCKHGHPFDKENTYIGTNGRFRTCRLCSKLRAERRRQKHHI